ncbi:MAG: DUF6134 family protein [Daejeonella sp.]
MIPALLIWLYKKYASRIFKTKYLTRFRRASSAAALLLIPVLTAASPSSAQDLRLSYQVIHKGSVIGQMQFHRKVSGINTYFNLKSDIKTRFVMPINIVTTDQAHFSKGRLQLSAVCRTVNGQEKESKKTVFRNNTYELSNGSKLRQLETEIGYTMMMLYCREPAQLGQVYSDNYQQFLPIKRLAAHTYRVNLPGGNYNDYQFEGGTCIKVTVHHDWYTITMELI